MLDIVTKWGKCYYKMGSFLFYKTGQVVLQRRVGITEWHNFYYKMRGGVFQSGAIITKKRRIVQKDSDNSVLEPHPMDTLLSIRHRFDVKFPRGKFVKITSILKGESTWKLWHRFDVDISTWIRLSKSTKYRWVLHVDFSMSFRRQIDFCSRCLHSPIF